MDASFNSFTAARCPRPRSTGRTPPPSAPLTALAENARTIVLLALAAYGLVHVVEELGAPWAGLVQTLVLALIALGFLVAARRSHDHRFGWLLSSCVAVGLAIAAFSTTIDGPAPPALLLPAAGALACIALSLLVVRRVQRRSHR
jgi:hypothetical protein